MARFLSATCRKNSKGHDDIPATRMVNNDQCPRSNSYIMVRFS